MDEKTVRQEVNRGLQVYGYWPLTQDGASRIKYGVGRPDSIVIHPDKEAIVIEYKVLYLERNKSFAFSEIKDAQRKWQDRWLEVNGLGYIGLGIIDRPKKYQKIIDMFLIDWEHWLIVENECIECGSQSIPYVWHNRASVPEQLEISSKFRAFRMFRAEGQWRLPPFHSAIP